MQSPTIAEIPPLDLSRFFEVHPQLETERLILRQRRMDDKDDIFEYASIPEVPQYMPWDPHKSIADTVEFLERSAANTNRESLGFAIELKATGKMIGDCAYHHFSSRHHSAQIGYVLNPNYWGQGLMSEAVRELLRFAFQDMGMHRIEAHCDQENERSARVLERCGMSLEGVFKDYELRKGRFITTKVYGLLASDR